MKTQKIILIILSITATCAITSALARWDFWHKDAKAKKSATAGKVYRSSKTLLNNEQVHSECQKTCQKNQGSWTGSWKCSKWLRRCKCECKDEKK